MSSGKKLRGQHINSCSRVIHIEKPAVKTGGLAGLFHWRARFTPGVAESS
jgi:hypothetical protein